MCVYINCFKLSSVLDHIILQYNTSEIFQPLSQTLIFRNPVPKSRNFNWDATESNEKDLRFLFIKSPSKFEMMKNDNLGNQKFWDSLPIDERQIGKTTPIDMRHEEL